MVKTFGIFVLQLRLTLFIYLIMYVKYIIKIKVYAYLMLGHN